MIKDRVYWKDDITENFVTECLIKVQTLFESICGNESAGWMDKKLQKYLWTVVYQHKKPEKGICMLQMFVTILTAGWYGPACPVQL